MLRSIPPATFIQMGSKGTNTVPTDEDDEFEEIETLVYVDFESNLLEDQISETNLKMKFIGIDTEQPILQVNNKIFRGK